MSGFRIAWLLAIPVIIGSLLATRSPFMMTASAPTSAKPWADGPMKMVVTPLFQTKKTDVWTTGATHMGLAHNAILRSFNSIYLQATHIPDSEKPAFVGYAHAWYRFVTLHHESEEQELFPKIEEVLKDKTVFDESIREHEAFLAGLAEYNTYLTSLKSPSAFSGTQLRRIMDGFLAPFESHFHSEIAALAALATHPNAPARGSAEDVAAAAYFAKWGREAGSNAGFADGVPFFLLNVDRTAEDGLWQNWPPMPAPVRWGIVNLAGAWHSAWWKFASCDAAGKPRELWALQFPERKD